MRPRKDYVLAALFLLATIQEKRGSEMKRVQLLFLLCAMLCMVSCNKKNDNILSYSSDEIYLKCVEYGNIIKGFPKELLILETEEQLEYALNGYECINSLQELGAIMLEYPIGEYIYILQYFETAYGNKVVCNELNVDEIEIKIHLEHEIKNPKKENPAAIVAYITYAVLPKEYLNGYDFSNQQGVLYLGK